MKNEKNLKILVAAGGTGGHIIPALAIAAEFKKNYDAEILFVGNRNSLEEKLATQAGLNFAGINVQKLYRKFTLAHLFFPFKLGKSIYDSFRIIKKFKPNFFVGTGGFVSGPVGFAAHLKKIPVFLQEQNGFPGLTTRILSKYAKKIFLGNRQAEKFFPKNKTFFSGNPINPNFTEKTEKLDFEKIGLKKNSLKLLILGGSQGSVIINQNFYAVLDEILKSGIEIIWQIGKFSYEKYAEKIKNKSGVFGFSFSSEMSKIYNSVDFAVSRAGAITLAELETKKIPAILIPLPSAAGNHQFYNALEPVNKKVAILLEQKNLTPEILKNKILEMKNSFEKMKNNFTETKHEFAAEIIAKEILKSQKEY